MLYLDWLRLRHGKRSSLIAALRSRSDTAPMYGNEAEVGEVIKSCDIPRSELWVTTKLEAEDHGYDATIAACHRSLATLGLDYIDLYLIHA